MAKNANNEGYIRLHRKFLDWEWYSDINTSRLFLHMLFKANWKPGRFQGVEVGRGEFVSSYSTLSEESGLSIMSARTAVKHLISTGEITVNKHSKFTVFTINNYSKYQDDNTQANSQLTGDQQAANKQLTTIEESKKEIKEEVKNKEHKYSAGFCAVWEAYPRKNEKGQAYRQYKARLNDGFSEDELITAVKRYADQCREQHTDKRYIKLCSTFLGPNTPFLDFLEKEVKEDEGWGSTEDFYREYLAGCDG